MSCNCTNDSQTCQNCFGGINIPQGPIGSKGDKGDLGDTGITGPEGPQGDQGVQGDSGSGSSVPGPQGDQGEQGVQGAQGDSGADGLQGLQGLPGEEGPQGIDGPQGPSGNDGVNGTTFDTYISDLSLGYDLVLAETLIPGMTATVGSGTGNYLVQYELFMSTNPATDIIIKIDGITVETLNVGVLAPGERNVSNFWIGNIDDGKSVEIFGVGTDGFNETVAGFKFMIIRLG